ncbi:MAG: zinc ribbon domain-containing protein [Candidatus Neomarinimicrobiota bacterium]
MRRLLLAGLTAFGLAAGAPPVFEELVFSLWPEYDHPGVLVIYSGRLAAENLPQVIEFRVPAATEQVLAAGVLDTTRELRTVTIESRGAEKWVKLELQRPAFHFEFYYNPFGDTHQRQVDYELEFGHPVPAFMLAVQKPIMAENYTLPETDMESFQDQHGMTFFRKQMPALKANTVKKLSFSYENHTAETSIQQLQKMLASENGALGGGMPGGAERPLTDRHRLPLLEPLLVLALAAIVLGGLFYRQRRREGTEAVASEKTGRFCTKCGQPVKQLDKFCANCGARQHAADPV